MIDNVQNETVKTEKHGFLGGLIPLAILGLLVCIVPVYMQNCINSLYGTYYGLREKANLLNREILLQEFEINKLTSLEYLADFAERAELGLYDVPMKIMVTGESHE
jgi:hypothetical protein